VRTATQQDRFSRTDDRSGKLRSPGPQFDPVAAVAAVVREDVHVGSTAAAGAEAALEQIVARGTAAEQARSSSPLLADAMLTHARHFTCATIFGASNGRYLCVISPQPPTICNVADLQSSDSDFP